MPCKSHVQFAGSKLISPALERTAQLRFCIGLVLSSRYVPSTTCGISWGKLHTLES